MYHKTCLIYNIYTLAAKERISNQSKTIILLLDFCRTRKVKVIYYLCYIRIRYKLVKYWLWYIPSFVITISIIISTNSYYQYYLFYQLILLIVIVSALLSFKEALCSNDAHSAINNAFTEVYIYPKVCMHNLCLYHSNSFGC